MEQIYNIIYLQFDITISKKQVLQMYIHYVHLKNFVWADQKAKMCFIFHNGTVKV